MSNTSQSSLFEILSTTRSIKRLKPDPVPMELIRKVLDAGVRAPSGLNSQPWEFLVIRDPDAKKFIQERYLHFSNKRFAGLVSSLDSDHSPHARMLRTVVYLAEHLHEVPVLLLVCGHCDWPATVPVEKRVGKAPPPYGSIYPCVQNILLACRALGLGASLTTMHQMFEDDLHERFGIPAGVGIVAMIPIGYPKGKFGRVKRIPATQKTHYDCWSQKGESR